MATGGRPAYNAGMKTAPRTLLRLPLLAAFALASMASVGGAWAQAPVPAPAQAPARAAVTPAADAPAPSSAGKANQTIKRIRTEDAGSRIDELRVGGETQQITVQPKTDVPAYEVKPAEGARGTAPAAAGGETNGKRVWNFLKF